METPSWALKDEKLNYLMRSVQTGRIVHALLFTGAPGTGRRTMAKYLSQTLLCTGENKPCGECPACKQFEAEMHPDFRRIVPEGNLIRVDRIRELIDYLSLRPVMGGRHIALIEQANRMNDAAQNALLKTLEEPQDNIVIFLTADSDSGLLPTILSRCQRIRFRESTVAECTEALLRRGVPADRARMLAGAAQGSVGKALALDTDESYFELRQLVLKALDTLKTLSDTQEAEKELSGRKEDASVILDILELRARDILAVQNGAEPYESDAAAMAKFRFSGLSMLRAVAEAREKHRLHFSWANILDTFFLRLIRDAEARA